MPKRGNVPWNKRNYTPIVSCRYCHKIIPKFDSHRNIKKFCNFKCSVMFFTGKPKSEEHIRKMKENHTRYWAHHKFSKEHIRKCTKVLKPFQSGKRHWNWKGGITPLLKSIRFGKEYKQWTKEVLKRDNWTCQNCRKRGDALVAHHIISLAKLIFDKNIKLLYDVSNGITLCLPCHRQTDSFAAKFGTNRSNS